MVCKMGTLRQIFHALLCLAIVRHSMGQAFDRPQNKGLAKKIHELCKKILNDVYVGRHAQYEQDQNIPENFRTKISQGQSFQTVAMGVDMKNKRIVVAGNIYTNEYKKDGSYKINQLGFLDKEMKQIYATIRNDPQFKDFSITVIKPDDNEMKIYEKFATDRTAQHLQQAKSNWWDTEKRNMEKAVKKLEADKRIPFDVKQKSIQTIRENFWNLKPPQSMLDNWKEYEQTAGAGDAARAVHAQVQIEKYLENNLGLSRVDRKNFVIQTSRPHCATFKEAKVGKLGHIKSVLGKSNGSPKNWGQTAKIVVTGFSGGGVTGR